MSDTSITAHRISELVADLTSYLRTSSAQRDHLNIEGKIQVTQVSTALTNYLTELMSWQVRHSGGGQAAELKAQDFPSLSQFMRSLPGNLADLSSQLDALVAKIQQLESAPMPIDELAAASPQVA